MNYFAKNLQYLRKQKRLTQKELADVLDINRSTLANYEQGTREPDLNSIIIISEFFGIDIDLLNKNLAHIPDMDFS